MGDELVLLLILIMAEEKKYWLPAKTHGWGWGFPSTWQGWLVLAGFVGFMIGAGCWFASSENLISYLVAVSVAMVLLLFICYRKGEPPRWRWGSSEDGE